MKQKRFIINFKAGNIVVFATNVTEAKILAQAEAIQRGWDYEIQPTMTKKDAKNYLQNVLDNWTEFCKDHIKFALAIQTLLCNTTEM